MIKQSLLAIVATATIARAQVRGYVRDGTTNRALSGAVVTVLDSTGTARGRAITDANGSFSLAPVAAARIRLIRIGYKPRDLALASGDTLVNIAMDKLPPVLDAVRVTGNELCPGSADQGAAFQLWEQARAGLLATIVSRESKPAAATTLLYETRMSPKDDLVRRQTTRAKSGQTTRPFLASSPPSYFARVGYMLEDHTMRTYYAPDADVLVDESFAATHCFRLRRADDAHTGQLGLAFSPIPGRDTLVDVEGVIWLDVQNPALRSLDFRYTSLEPAAADANSGGHIEFRTMKNGVSFIERWNLRMVTMEPVSAVASENIRRDALMRRINRRDRHDLRASELVDAGGIVVDAAWPDGERYDAPKSGITGTVVQRGGGPARNALVTIEGTADTVRTNDDGSFRMNALPGRYTVIAVDTALEQFVAPRMQTSTVRVVRGAFASATFQVTDLERVINDVCSGQRRPPLSVVLVGSVSMSGAALPGVTEIAATWQADYSNDARGLEIQTRSQVVHPDGKGRFVVCGVAHGRPVHLQLRLANAILADTTLTYTGTDTTVPVNWVVRTRAPR